MEPILNRWRGTGIIFWKLSGNIIYAIYWFILISFLSSLYYNIYYSIIFGLIYSILYIVGESFSWGKWVGYLTSSEESPKKEYDSKVGKSFPYIHYIAETFVEQRDDYKTYCRIALSIRGLFWWVLPILFLYIVQLIPIWFISVSLLILSFGFPLACEIGKNIKYEYHSKYLNLSRGWENQELIYGLFHSIAITLPLMYFNIF